MTTTVQLWKCDKCGGEAPYGSSEPPGPTKCLTNRCGGTIDRSRMFEMPPKPEGAAFFHWGEMRWKS